MRSYKQFHESLISQLGNAVRATPPFNGGELTELQALFLSRLEKLENCDTYENIDQQRELGQWVTCSIISHYPHLTTSIARDLLWYFGGDCLHFLGDAEIAAFQTLDERFYAISESNESVNFEKLRHELLGDSFFEPIAAKVTH